VIKDVGERRYGTNSIYHTWHIAHNGSSVVSDNTKNGVT